MALDRYVARLCWNTAGWEHPTGAAAGSESGDTYNNSHGFGHEEWAFNFNWMLDGWKYGFLQPVNRSIEKVGGQTLDIKLYTINPDGRVWSYVGHIRRCEVLTKAQAAATLKEFKRRGWFDEMVKQVKSVGGKTSGLRYPDARLMFNIRYRRKDVDVFDPMIPVGPRDAIRRLRRYTLTRLSTKLTRVESEWKTRTAAASLRTTGKRKRSAVAASTITLAHNQLQNDLCVLLRGKYGSDAVALEKDFVDLTLRRKDKPTLIEVKSDLRARDALRASLGQLLEYAFVAGRRGDPPGELVVVAPGKPTNADHEYLKHLRATRKLPIRYVQFSHGMKDVDL